jgi:hypothetical protein
MSIEYRNAVLAKNPVGYWRLGDAPGPTAVDQTSNGYDGVYLAGPARPDAGAIAGDTDHSLSCLGPFYVEVPDSEDFSQPTSGAGLTVEAWVRPDWFSFPGQTADPYVHWLGKGEARQLEWGLRFYSQNSSRPNRISAYIWNPHGGEGAGAYFQDVLVAGQWIHVVACFDPGDLSDPTAGVHIYKDGVPRLGPPSPGTLYSNPKFKIAPRHGTAPLRIGTLDLGSFLFGAVDEVAVYPRVLSPDEVLENYNLGTTTP